MSHIDIRRHHGLGVAGARECIVQIERELESRFGAGLDWSTERTASVRGRGVTGTVDVDDEDVRIRMTVGLLFRPLVRRIGVEVEKALDRAFPAPPA
ncbi:MAG: polyhydroxyalkanoic acid system family protein [Sandaracinaceae bacterium]